MASREAIDLYVDELLGREAELCAAITLLRQRLLFSSESRAEPPQGPLEDSANLLAVCRKALVAHNRQTATDFDQQPCGGMSSFV
jgi:hypothetical protein